MIVTKFQNGIGDGYESVINNLRCPADFLVEYFLRFTFDRLSPNGWKSSSNDFRFWELPRL
jgi:hypothetical protein